MRYVKKPIEVEAEEYLDESILEFTGDNAFIDYLGRLCIRTLEGLRICNKRDFIIRGITGEYYPCRRDIFFETYEEVEEDE